MAGSIPVPSVRCSCFLLVCRWLLSTRIVHLTGVICGIISWRRLWEGSWQFKPLSHPGHKSCMVLTRSMATTNNVQEDEQPRSTALERQVQTLAAAVECLTKQNHDLEEQLRQKDAGHNIQEENQGDSSERRGLERLEGSNEPCRLERRNLSMPSLTDTTPPPILAEMQAMKEQIEVMMNALKGRVSSDLDDLVNRTDSPFTTQVNSCPLPQKFRMP